MKSEIKKYLQKIGKTGGMAKNDRKRDASRRNLETARKVKQAKKTHQNANVSDFDAFQKQIANFKSE